MTACGQSDQPREAPHAVGGRVNLQGWDFNNDGFVSLSGEWAFYWQELLTPSQVESHKSSKFVQVPTSWTSYQIDGQTLPPEGYATYQLTLQLDPSESYELYIAGEGTAYNLWVDGQLVAGNGHVADNPPGMIPQSEPETVFFQPNRNTTDIVIQISNFYDQEAGFKNAILLGLPPQIDKHEHIGWAEDGFVTGIFLIIGIYNIFLYAYRPKDKSLLYFALWSFLSLIRVSLQDQMLILFFLPGISWELIDRIKYLLFYVSPSIYLLFIYTLFPRDILASILKTVIGIGALFSIITLFSETLILNRIYIIYYSILLLGVPYFIYFIGRILKKKMDGAGYIAAASLVGFIIVILEYLYIQNIIFFRIESVYAFLAFILIQVVMLSSRFSKSFLQVEALSKDLNEKNTKLSESERKYRGIFEDSKDMIFILDAEGQIKITNPTSQEILGYSQNELKKTNLLNIIVHEKDKLQLANIFRKGHAIKNYEVELY